MSYKLQALALLLPLLFSVGAAYDIEERLAAYSSYATFLKALADTKVADDIAQLPKATILVVQNSVASALSSLPADKVKQILSYHVLLDYYDTYSFSKTLGQTALVETLWHSKVSGDAGYLNATCTTKETVSIGDGAAGSPLNSKLLKVVDAHPYSFCVMEISALVMPGAGGASPATPSASDKSSPATPSASDKTSPATPSDSDKASPATPSDSDKASPATPSATPPTATQTPPSKSSATPAPAAETPTKASSSASESASNASTSTSANTADSSAAHAPESSISSQTQASDASTATAKDPPTTGAGSAKAAAAAAPRAVSGAMAGLLMGSALFFDLRIL